jgi:hypothetical protein
LFRKRIGEDMNQLLRRITEIKLFGESPVIPPDYAPTFIS